MPKSVANSLSWGVVLARRLLRLASAAKRRRAIAAIRNVGGRIVYDWQIVSRKPPVPRWLRTLLADAILYSVVEVDFEKTQVTDAGLVHLKALTEIEVLDLTGTQVTDAGLVHLKALKNLQGLDLSGTQVTDIGLEGLKTLSKLQYLGLVFTQVTDEGLMKLQQALPNCEIEHQDDPSSRE